MKGILLSTIILLSVNLNLFAEFRIKYSGEPLPQKYKDKIEVMLQTMYNFYSAIDSVTESEVELETSDDLPEVVTVVTPEAAAPVPVIDAMIAKQSWRTDMPGSSVRDVRSAISLNDRILFINYLFGEDPMSFQEMLTQLNAMSSFDEAAAYAIAAHPEWDLESDTVYRFMMALRRRHQ